MPAGSRRADPRVLPFRTPRHAASAPTMRPRELASLLLPLVGFMAPTDPRMLGTVRAIERDLMWEGIVLRYRAHPEIDGLPAGEGAFLACSFWLADNYVLQGRSADAVALFERLVGLCNDVGLLAEEYAKLLAASNRDVHDDSKTTTLPIAREIVEVYVTDAVKLPWYIDLLNICLETNALAEAKRRIRLLAEAFRKDGTRITENLDFGA